MGGTISVLVGTTKGLFILDGQEDRASWELRGPFCGGWPINHAIGDRETGEIWAAGGNEFMGAGVWRSADGGAQWSVSRLSNGEIDKFLADEPDFGREFGIEPAAPAPFTGQVNSIWSLGSAKGALYAGTKPAALFKSTDRGETWSKVRSLSEHPSAESWEPGGAGLVLHSIVTAPEAPERIWLGISAAGVFASEDGGASWDRRNRRSNAAEPDGHPTAWHDPNEVGHCVHNLVRAPGDRADLLYQQNHHGVFRSQDGGRSWQEITAGLPSAFGFPIAVHPRDPRTIWVLPLAEEFAGRYPQGGAAAVWRSRDGGDSWTAQREGLPARNCFFTVLRQAMATDRQDRAGVYFGTNSGSVFASRDEGESWAEVARHLPTVLCVETLDRI